jgi:hypothetical protein
MSGNLGITQVVASQDQKEVTINAALLRLDAAITETFDADLTSGNVTVTTTQGQQAAVIRAANVATSGRTVTVPLIERVFVIFNPATSSHSVGFVRGTTTITLAPGSGAVVRTDGTANGLTQVVSGGGSSGVTLEDEGSAVAGGPHTTLNFTGAGVSVANAGGGEATVTISGGSSGITVEDEGSTVTGGPHTALNFVGAGVSVANAGGGEATVTITGGSGGITLEDEGSTVTGGPHTTLNFTGAGVSVANAGGGEATVTISGGGGGGNSEGRPHVVPVVSSFAWVNQGSATATDRSYGISMASPFSSGDSFRMLTKAAPSTPYEVRIRFAETRCMLNNVANVFGWRDSSSGNIQPVSVYYGVAPGENRLAVFNFSSPTAFVSTQVSPVAQSHRLQWIRLRDNGTDRFVDTSADGDEWVLFASFGRTSYITPDQVFFGLNVNNLSATPSGMTILSWEEL